ncbi:MAG: type 1 glutamine amidotransferase domain-containing protein [Candidatus Ozemobacteraceae bacterium]
MKRFSLLVIAAVVCVSLCMTPVQAKSIKPRQADIVMVLSGTDKIPGTDRETGFWAEEFIVPLKIFKSAGYKVIVTSLNGGWAPVDPGSIDPKNIGAEHAKEVRMELDKEKSSLKTVPMNVVKLDQVKAIFVVGGHGVMWDLTESTEMKSLAQKMYAAGKIISAVCHGPGALVHVRLPDGKFLLDGKKVTGFSAKEEEIVGMSKVVPYCLEAELKKSSGDNYESVEPWKSFVVVDGTIVTGQNPASSAETARAVLKLLAAGQKKHR